MTERSADNSIMAQVNTDWTRCQSAWNDNRIAYEEDIRFARLGEQWSESARKERQAARRPILTINKLPPFIRQVVNDARQNKPSIKVLPQDSMADPATAEIYSGLIRNIETTSDADVAYDTALECAASGGFGFFRINLSYVNERSFDQDIRFERIANPMRVYPDPDSEAADSSDWNVCFVAEPMPKAEFDRRYPDQVPAGGLVDSGIWLQDDQVVVAEYWTREEVETKVVLLSTGDFVDKADYDANPLAFIGPDGLPAEIKGEPRDVISHKVTQRIVNGSTVLKTTEWAGKYIPIIPVYGEEVNIEGRRVFRSLIRDAKDAQVLYNVGRSASAEFMALAPKAPFMVEKGSLVDEDKWATANIANHAYLEYSKGSNMPQRQGMPTVATGPLQEALTASDEMKSIIGIYDAGIGARSNETSGRAIMARQRESDTSTFHFIDNLSRAIRHAGRILLDLIPKVYTPGRVARILGEDGAPQNVQIGDAEQARMTRFNEGVENIYALDVGSYDLTVSVGPGFNSRREEAATQMMELIRAYPAAAPYIGDLLVKNLDWPGADEIAKRLAGIAQQMTQQEQGQGQAAPQQPQGPDPLAVAKAQTDQFNAQVKAQQGQEKLQIDAFRAETDRMSAAARIQQPTRLPAMPNIG
jgi:hypothetical protein